MTRQSRSDNLERSPQAAAFAAGLQTNLYTAALNDEEQEERTERTERTERKRGGLFSPEETQEFTRSYNEAMLAAGNANDISEKIEQQLLLRKDNPRQQSSGHFSYEEALIGLFSRAKRSGVDWSQMFAVTDRNSTGTVRERDFREALSHIEQADVRFPGLSDDEVLHVVGRFLATSDRSVANSNSVAASSVRHVEYRRFVEYYTNYVHEVDEGGFINLGQLPTKTTSSYQEEEGGEEEEEVEVLAGRLASMAERQMYSGGEALDPNSYSQQSMLAAVREGSGGAHDQTDRLNRALAGAMLTRMNGHAQQTLEETGGSGAGEAVEEEEFDFDPAIMNEVELQKLMASRNL